MSRQKKLVPYDSTFRLHFCITKNALYPDPLIIVPRSLSVIFQAQSSTKSVINCCRKKLNFEKFGMDLNFLIFFVRTDLTNALIYSGDKSNWMPVCSNFTIKYMKTYFWSFRPITIAEFYINLIMVKKETQYFKPVFACKLLILTLRS